MQRHASGRNSMAKRRGQGGYVLVMVLAALALIALVAGRFAARVDALREQAATLSDYAQGRAAAYSALQAGLYWVGTRQVGPGGYGAYPQPALRGDGRPYSLPGGAELRVQDLRGLYPLNTAQREGLARLLRGLGAPSDKTDSLIDVLLDYQDTDSLKRLNGAETDDYRALGLPAPRNDWLLAVSELQRLPVWREQPALVAALQRVVSVSRIGQMNPNTMPEPLLKAWLPDARPEQLELFLTLRRQQPFDSGAAVLASSGLRLLGDDFLYHASDALRITVWAPGLPQAYQYNVTLVPDGSSSAWVLSDMQPETRDKTFNAPSDRATPFPLAIGSSPRP
jgi:hypothetical protein